MENPSNRYDLTDRQWEKWEPIIQKQLGKWGGRHANDIRTLINGVGWILRTESPLGAYPMSTSNLTVFISVSNVGVTKVIEKPFSKS